MNKVVGEKKNDPAGRWLDERESKCIVFYSKGNNCDVARMCLKGSRKDK